MKTLILTVLLAFSALFAHAEVTSDYTKVSSDRLEDYKTAIRSAIAQNPDSVNACDPKWIYQTPEFLNEIYVNKSSAQPLLLVNTYYSVNDDILHRMVIETTPDLKHITHVTAEIYQMGEVNKGDLAHPVIVNDYVLQTRTNCTRQVQN